MSADAGQAPPAADRVGFVGLGTMGRPMAARLHAAGLRLVVHDLSPAAVLAFRDAHPGVEAATGPEAFAGCGVVITMLPDSDAVESVALGTPSSDARALLSALRPGAVLVDMSSSDPIRTRALAAKLAARGVAMLDAPVSGGVRRAVDGTLAIMVGGEPEVHERCRALLGHLGSSVTRVGASGCGHAMKALNNYVSAAGLIAAVEALTIGESFGIDPGVMTDVLNASTGRNNSTENKLRQFVLSGRFDAGFSLALMDKDLRTARALKTSLALDAKLCDEVSELWARAAGVAPAGADHTEIYRFVRGEFRRG